MARRLASEDPWRYLCGSGPGLRTLPEVHEMSRAAMHRHLCRNQLSKTVVRIKFGGEGENIH